MLPFALKVIWFCLSFSGIIVCWVVQWMFSRAISSYWAPVLYSVFATSLQGVVCLGMIYEMDPYQMPKVFCIVQTFVIYYSAWSLAGVCAAFTFATFSPILWPSPMKHSAASTLAWKHQYYVPILVFPLACLCISVPVLLRVNAIRPADDLYCDASHPEWGRFLGYAGLTMIPSIPCFFFSVFAVRRVMQLQRVNQRTPFSVKSSASRFHSRSELSLGQITAPERHVVGAIKPKARSVGLPDEDGPGLPLYAMLHRISASHEALGVTAEDNEFHPLRRVEDMSSSTTRVVPLSAPDLAPAIWRLILFQTTFFIIQCLAALSTIIDIAQRRPTPIPFGSQHIALILVGWGPVVVFGHLPAVRRQLMFWKE